MPPLPLPARISASTSNSSPRPSKSESASAGTTSILARVSAPPAAAAPRAACTATSGRPSLRVSVTSLTVEANHELIAAPLSGVQK